MIRLSVRIWGSVQGVGFRWRARSTAVLLGVAGFVKNEDDGSVYLELEGERETVEQALDYMERGSFIRFDHVERREIDPIGERDFYVWEED